MPQGSLWRSQRPEALSSALLLEAFRSSRLCSERASQQHQALRGLRGDGFGFLCVVHGVASTASPGKLG